MPELPEEAEVPDAVIASTSRPPKTSAAPEPRTLTELQARARACEPEAQRDRELLARLQPASAGRKDTSGVYIQGVAK